MSRMIPMDIVADTDFHANLVRARGTLETSDIALLVIASALNSPAAAAGYQTELGKHLAVSPDDPSVLAKCVWETVAAMHGDTVDHMHNEISKTGFAGKTSGVIFLARRFGLKCGRGRSSR